MTRGAFHLLLALLLLPTTLWAAEFRVTPNTVVALADVDDARKALRTEDDFIRESSDFDRAARVKSEEPIAPEQFLKFIEGEALAWSDADAAKIKTAVSGVREKLSKFKIMLPRRVLLVQTTGREEGNAGYCRGTNIVVLPRRFVNLPADALESVLIHELFHLLSRNNPELRASLYALIGFKPCGNIQFPAELDSLQITNPDAPRLDFFIEVVHHKQKLAVVPVLFAKEKWNKQRGGEFFKYLLLKLMAVERVNESWRAVRSNDKPMLLDPDDVTNLREQIGEEPGPVLQAEEILAEYFVKVVEGREGGPPQVLGGIRRLLEP